MRTILHILVILLVAAIVAGGVYTLVENTTLVSSTEAERAQPTAITSADGRSAGSMERPGGAEEPGVSFTRGLSEVLGTLGKLSAITVVVLLLQRGSNLLRNLKLKSVHS